LYGYSKRAIDNRRKELWEIKELSKKKQRNLTTEESSFGNFKKRTKINRRI